MISIILYGRNDNYGYNLHKRAALSLNCMAEVLTDSSDEIVFVDYNTPDDFPTFPEAIEDTLTEEARKRLRILRVRPEIHRRFAEQTHLKALEPVARNVGLRRSNPENRWVLSTNTDMIFVPRRKASLTEVARDIPKAYYGIPRFEVPEALWETFDRMDAPGVIKQVGCLGWDLHLNEIVYGAEIIKYDAPGDFQLIERADLFAIDGFNESMLLGWHVDSNIAKRLHLIYGEVGDLVDEVFGYHCDHTRQVTPAHRKGAPQNSIKFYIDEVTTSCLPQQSDIWGCAHDDIEEVRLDKQVGRVYISGLRASIGAPMEHMSHVRYSSETFDKVFYDPPHLLPYLMDLFFSLPRRHVVAWFGGNSATFTLFCRMWKMLGFCEPILITKESADYLGIDSNDATKVLNIIEVMRDADAYVFDFVYGNGVAFGKTCDQHCDCLAHYLTRSFLWIVANEQYRIEEKKKLRHIIAINAIHNRFEALVNSNLEAALTPMSARIRHGYVIPVSGTMSVGGRSWSPLMIPGGAGERYRKGIRSFAGNRGHMAFGPCGPLAPGKYRVTAALKAGNSLRSFCQLFRPCWRPPVVCEVVTGDRCLAQRPLYGHTLLHGSGLRNSRQFLEFTVSKNIASDYSNPERNVEFRIWTRGKLDLRLTKVEIERINTA